MEELHKRIKIRAYEYYLSRGMIHGDDIGDWLKAEKDILKKRNKSLLKDNPSSKKTSIKIK